MFCFICTFLTKATCCQNIEIVLHPTTLSYVICIYIIYIVYMHIIYVNIYRCIYIYIYMYIYIYIYIYMYIHIYVYTDVYIYTSSSWRSIASDEDVSESYGVSAAQSWTRKCDHTGGMQQQPLGHVFFLCEPGAYDRDPANVSF